MYENTKDVSEKDLQVGQKQSNHRKEIRAEKKGNVVPKTHNHHSFKNDVRKNDWMLRQYVNIM